MKAYLLNEIIKKPEMYKYEVVTTAQIKGISYGF